MIRYLATGYAVDLKAERATIAAKTEINDFANFLPFDESGQVIFKQKLKRKPGEGKPSILLTYFE